MGDALTVWQLARLVGVQRGMLRHLSGFQRSRHREPVAHDAAAERFVLQLAGPAVVTRSDELFASLRTAFQFTRREMNLERSEGSALIHTPRFACRMWLEQDPDDPAAWRMPLEVGGFADDAILSDPAFHAVFADTCDRLVLSLPQAIDVLERVDALEADGPRRGLEYDPAGAWLQLVVPQDDLVLRCTAHEISVSLVTPGDLGKLLERGQALVGGIGGVGSQALPGEG